MGEIGRLPAIEDWIHRFNNRMFPYNSPHTPSSYPVIFFLAYPFYLIGNAGLLSFFGSALLLFFIIKQKGSLKGMLTKIIIVVLSVITVYEIVTRSELMFNIMLVVVIVFLCERYLRTTVIDLNFIYLSVLTGLVLSTRSITALLFVIYFLYKFRYDLGRMFLFGTISILIFILILLPFYLWDPQSFVKNGPFAVQSYLSNLPSIFIIIIFIAAVYSGWVISEVREFYFSAGIILFFAAFFSFVFRTLETGLYGALIDDGYDIAYFIFCVPLLILSLKDKK